MKWQIYKLRTLNLLFFIINSYIYYLEFLYLFLKLTIEATLIDGLNQTNSIRLIKNNFIFTLFKLATKQDVSCTSINSQHYILSLACLHYIQIAKLISKKGLLSSKFFLEDAYFTVDVLITLE